VFNNLKLSHRFTVAIGSIVLGFLIYCVWSFQTLNQLMVNGPMYKQISETKDLIADILPPPAYVIESYLVTLQLQAATESTERELLVKNLAALRVDFDTRQNYWGSSGNQWLTVAESELLRQSRTAAEAMYAIAFEKLIPALRNQDNVESTVAMQLIKASYQQHRNLIDKLVKSAITKADAIQIQAKNDISAGKISLLIVMCVSLAVGLTTSISLIRTLLKQLGGEPSDTTRAAHDMAEGDLTKPIITYEDDERSLTATFKHLQAMLIETVTKIEKSAGKIYSASGEIAAGNTDLSHRTEQQAASLEETASSMEQLTAAVKQNADNARQANQLAVGASDTAQRGSKVVSDVVTTMGGISESSRKISEIISVIDSIAFQTNILALNAAVEAARAGEQGRGFAVVASEVRNLAQRSAAAAKEVNTLISDSVSKVEAGSKLVDEAGNTMQEILVSVKHVTDIMGEITAASREQSSGIEQVNSAITQMDHVTQQNAALVEQAAAAAMALNDEAQGLQEAIAIFKLSGSGNSAVNYAKTTELHEPSVADMDDRSDGNADTLPQRQYA
jgi:methyl-accepting chemotaxis protein